MADKSTSELELLITAQAKQFERELNGVQKQLAQLQKTGSDTSKTLSGGFKSALPEISAFTIGIAAGAAAFGTLANAASRAMAFQDTLADLSAITGVTGAALDDIGAKATSLSNTFGTTASENVDAFKGVLSRLGPGIASNSEALQMMGSHINTLSVAAGLDATASMDALTTAMLQFNVDLSDPMKAAEEMGKMMNVMAAGAQQGAAEVPQIAQALVVAGVSAKSAGVSFEETNSALQILATGGLYGAEAGTALRNVFVRLQAPTADATAAMKRFGIDSQAIAQTLTTQGLQAAVEQLRGGFEQIKSPVDRAALLNKVFGESAQNAAQILMTQSDAFKDLTVVMTGTNTATEQAKVKMNTFTMQAKILGEQVMNRLTDAFIAAAPALTSLVTTLADFVPVLVEYAPLVATVVTATAAAGSATKVLGGILNASPMKLYATVVAGVLVSVKALSDAMKTTQAETLEQQRAEEELIVRKKESAQASLTQAENNKRLADRYAELAQNAQRTKAEEAEMQKIKAQLNEQYPGVINNTKDFATQLKDVQGVALSAAQQIDKYRKELSGLDAQLVKSRRSQANTAVYAELEAVIDEVAEANKGLLNRATGAVLGTDTVQQQVAEFFAPLQKAIAKAFNEQDLQNVEGQFASIIEKASQAGDIDAKTANMAFKGMQKVIEKRREYLALIQGAAAAQKQEGTQGAATPPPPPPEAKPEKKAKDKKEDPLAGTIGAMEAELAKIEEEMRNKLATGSDAFLVADAKAQRLRDSIKYIKAAFETPPNIEAMSAAFVRVSEEAKAPLDDLTASAWEFEYALNSMSSTTERFAEIAETAFMGIGESLGASITDGTDAIKTALKSTLVAILDAINAEYLAAGAAVAIRALISGGFSLFADSAGWLLAGVALQAAKGAINSYAVGTDMIPRDQLAMVHKGEMIIPRTFAEGVRDGDISITGSQSAKNTVSVKRKSPQKRPTPTMHISSFRSAQNAAAYENARGVM